MSPFVVGCCGCRSRSSILRASCLTRATVPDTLSTVIDSFAVSSRDCTGPADRANSTRRESACSPSPSVRMSNQPLADQIVAGIKRQIDDRYLRPGTQAALDPQFRRIYKVSRFTVVEAYDRLVAMGYLQSRRGAGFYTAARPRPRRRRAPAPSDNHKRNEELVWLIRRLLEADEERRARRRPMAAEFVARRSRHPPEPQRARRARTAPICSNTATRSAICRCASISR